jgi:hypothetical protein
MSIPGVTDDTPLGEARRRLDDEVIAAGAATCPCCGVRTRVYPRQMYAAVMEGFLHAHRRYGQDWFHWWRTTQVPGGDHSKLEYWGLMVAASRNRDPNEPGVGYYRITDLGDQFARGVARVPRYANVYRGALVGLDEERGAVSIRDVVSEGFDYDALMGRS